ncbi:FkbM family methyltransferase [Edaphobacter bradus]|uniref:FkbM family methyltransferase n=1 Tax=Edaphobacter bradus TaxID=2259016 RepID=UPI0021E03E71|nr:FkbM family methyltransferase [Edaphobacter bradus]
MSLKQIALKYIPNPVLQPVRARHYQNQLKHYDLNAEPDLLGCKALLRPGDIVIDIGANIGVYTRFCSEFVGASGRVFSLEPIPETFSYLTNNVRSLGLTNVSCYNLAASDHDQDRATMSIPQYSTGGANIYEATLSQTGDIPVKVTRLDTLFPDLSPNLIKCDVEGHEVACINGALQIIARARPRWIVEVSGPRTFELFASLGYDAFVYDKGSFRPAIPTDKTPNYFFFPRENNPSQGSA